MGPTGSSRTVGVGARVQPRLADHQHLGDIELELTVELGRLVLTLEHLGQLALQDVIELDKLAGEPFEVRVNDELFAFGEVVVVSEIVACRLTSLAKLPATSVSS